MCEIIGRKNEIAELKRCYNSGRAEFVAVYGRRRVGKTFLVNELFHDDVVFHHTGLSPYDRQRRVSTKDQLQNFYFSLIRHGMEGISQPKSWLEAFFLLEKFLDINENGSRQVVFIDELPWMDTARSGSVHPGQLIDEDYLTAAILVDVKELLQQEEGFQPRFGLADAFHAVADEREVKVLQLVLSRYSALTVIR